LGDYYFGGTDCETVAEIYRVLEQALGREVLAERAEREILAGQLFLPIRIVFDGIAINGFVFAAMDGKIGLAVTVQIELAESDGASDGFFEDAGGDDAVMPRDLAGKADVDRDELHGEAN